MALVSLLLLLASVVALLLPSASAQVGSVGVFPNSSDVSELWEQNMASVRSGGFWSAVMGSALDPNDGSLVLVGYATGALLSHVSVGGNDAFAVKLDPRSGQVIWSRWFATVQDDYLQGVCIDAAGNVFITGHTFGFMGGHTSLGNADVFVVKMTADGTQLWLQQIGTAGYEAAGNCVVDVYGQLYITGMSDRGYLSVASINTLSVFLTAMATADGSKVWGRNLGSQSGAQYLGIGNPWTYSNAPGYNNLQLLVQGGRGLSIVNPIANVSSAPILIVSVTLDAAAIFVDSPAAAAGLQDAVVAGYYANNGSIIWATRYASNGDDVIYATATDASGSTYVTGYTTSNLDGGLYVAGQDIFVSKVSITGRKLWTRLYGTQYGDIGTSVAVDNAGGVYVTGTSNTNAYTSLDHAPSAYAAVYPNSGGPTNTLASAFLSKFDSDGARLWTDLVSPSMSAVETYYLCPSMTPSTVVVDPVSQQVYVAGKKSGYLTTDTVQTALSSTDLQLDEVFVIAAQQMATNCTLQQFDTLLAQINALLLGL